MTTIDRCARAIAEVRLRYVVARDHSAVEGSPTHVVFERIALNQERHVFEGASAECQHWIDCQAAIACTEALLPVSDAVVEAIATPLWNRWNVDDSVTASEELFTAAITHIVKEG